MILVYHTFMTDAQLHKSHQQVACLCQFYCKYTPSPRPLSRHYQKKVINPGFNTIGNNKVEAQRDAIGKIATKRLIFQLQGRKGASASTIMATIQNKLNTMEYLNFLATLGTSVKKLANSSSLDVTPQETSISNMCARMAPEMWSEMPPKKMMKQKVHLKFSITKAEIPVRIEGIERH